MRLCWPFDIPDVDAIVFLMCFVKNYLERKMNETVGSTGGGGKGGGDGTGGGDGKGGVYGKGSGGNGSGDGESDLDARLAAIHAIRLARLCAVIQQIGEAEAECKRLADEHTCTEAYSSANAAVHSQP
jgi:hypothetical protein